MNIEAAPSKDRFPLSSLVVGSDLGISVQQALVGVIVLSQVERTWHLERGLHLGLLAIVVGTLVASHTTALGLPGTLRV
jgi:hypothetical protein